METFNQWVVGEMSVTPPHGAETLVYDDRCFTATLSAPASNPSIDPAPVAGVDIVASGRAISPEGIHKAFLPLQTEVSDANGNATFCYTATERQIDALTFTADHDGSGSFSQFEPGVETFNQWEIAELTLEPHFTEALVGQEHCVTATLLRRLPNHYAAPVLNGVPIVFTLRQGTSPTINPQRVLSADGGSARFCYTGPSSARFDSISAFVDHDDDGVNDPFEWGGEAHVQWSNVAPEVGPIAAPIDPVALGANVVASANFTDGDSGQTHTATWEWGDGSTSAGVVTEPSSSAPGSVAGEHLYASPGVYTVKLTVGDGGATGSAVFRYVVVYGTSGGSVTGGGWVESTPGSFTPDGLASGKASFGFNTKNRTGSVPTGSTEFQFRAGKVNFHSDGYQWLIVTGATAKYRGTGKVNGTAGYAFMVSVVDGDLAGGPDRFRMKIWNATSGEIIYDNQGADDDSAQASTALSGGSIVIHK